LRIEELLPAGAVGATHHRAYLSLLFRLPAWLRARPASHRQPAAWLASHASRAMLMAFVVPSAQRKDVIFLWLFVLPWF
jgi:hypothetical protein